jgi:hypothetical protein
MMKIGFIGACLLFFSIGLGGASALEAAGANLTCSVIAPDRGLLSLGVYDGQDTLVRSLAAAKPVEKGPLSFTWDATTDLGLPVAPGAYHVRGAWFPQAPRVKYVMKVGVSGDPPYTPADGRGGWGGNLGGPNAVCTNGKELTAVFCCVEDALTTGVQRMDFVGKVLGRYNTFFGWDVRMAGTMDDKHLYLAIAALGDHRVVIGKYDIGTPRGRILTDVPAGQHAEPAGRWKGRWTTDVCGLAVQRTRPLAASIARTIPSRPLRNTTPPATTGAVGSTGAGAAYRQSTAAASGTVAAERAVRALSPRYVGQSPGDCGNAAGAASPGAGTSRSRSSAG